MRALSLGVACLAVLSSSASLASQTRVHTVSGAGLLAGELEGASITGDQQIVAGPELKAMVASLPGAVLGLARGGDGQLYVATGTPGRVYRVNGAALELVHSPEKPLVTALLPVGASTLVALSTPDAGADVIDLKTKKATRIAAPAKLLLAGAVAEGVVYAVGSTDDGGVILRLPQGGKAFEVVATTKEALRSIAVLSVGGKRRIVVGGADEGVVYQVLGNTVRALLDATPGEVTSLAIAPDGTVFAGLADGEGKLSRQASAKAKEDESEEGDKKASKARKVKGGELWRIAPDGATRLLWQSKSHGPYAIAIDADRQRALVGTGPEGRVLEVALKGSDRVTVLTRKEGVDEITAVLAEKAGTVLGTAHGGAVLFMGTSRVTSSWLSPPLEAEGRARYGLARVMLEKGPARVFIRTGNTKTPEDNSWGPWSTAKPASVDGVTFDAEPALYAQLKVELSPGASASAVHLAYLTDNQAPEIVNIDVLAPGWRVQPNQRQPPESRSVTFGEKPFVRFLDRSGAQNPTMEERPYGKQSFDVGYRTVYAYAEDADKDALRYRFSLGRQQGAAAPTTWKVLADWAEEPFVSFEASRLADGVYRVMVEVSDSPTNGFARALVDTKVSAPFVVSHKAPAASQLAAVRSDGRVRVSFDIAADLPIVSARCSTDLADWLPLDPRDGILDGPKESFSTTLPATKTTDAVSCEIYDEALNFHRFDIPVR